MSEAGGGVLPRVADCFAAQGLMRNFGAEMTEADAGRCVIEIPWSEGITQQDGLFHGGVSAAVADAACGHAAMTMMPVGHNPLSVEFKLNLLAPAAGDRMRATATVIKSGRTLTVVGAKVEVRRDGQYHHCAEMLATMIGFAPRGDKN